VGDDGTGVTITFREVYDQIVGLRDDVRSLSQSSESVTKALDDHEQRLRGVERWKHRIPVALLTSLVASAVTAVMSVIKP
jgi:hypothetical protein